MVPGAIRLVRFAAGPVLYVGQQLAFIWRYQWVFMILIGPFCCFVVV